MPSRSLLLLLVDITNALTFFTLSRCSCSLLPALLLSPSLSLSLSCSLLLSASPFVHFRSTYTHNSHCDAVKRFVELMTLPAGVVIPMGTSPLALRPGSTPAPFHQGPVNVDEACKNHFSRTFFYSFPARRASFFTVFLFVIYIFHFSLWQKLPSTTVRVCVCVGIVVVITVIASRTQGAL